MRVITVTLVVCCGEGDNSYIGVVVRVITVTLVVCCGEGDNSYIGGVLW